MKEFFSKFFSKIKILDIIIIAFIISIIFISSFFIYSSSHSRLYLKVKTEHAEFIYPLDENKDIRIMGARGISEIRVENNEAFMLYSACPNKTCVSAKKLKNLGDWNACLPNKVFLSIESR